MRRPDPPFLEFSFYSESRTGIDLLLDLYRYLRMHGARFSGEIHVQKGPGFRDMPFAAITDPWWHAIRGLAEEELEKVIQDKDTRLVQIIMENATGVSADSHEILTQISVSPESMSVDSHPVAIWTEGTAFSGPPGKLPANAGIVGKKAYRFFKRAVSSLAPSYGSITSEYGLECPADLMHDPQTFAFENFYVSSEFLGNRDMARVKKMFVDAYQEDIPNGTIFCCYQYFSPTGQGVEHTVAEQLSANVGKLIARKCRL